jgi:WD40 repeat protein
MERKWRVAGGLVLAIVSVLAIRAGLQPYSWLDLALKRSGCLCTLEEHENEVDSVAFSPDGSALAINRQLWKVGGWTFLREMKSQRGGMGNVVFSPGGKMLAAGNASHEVRWWRVADGTLLRAVKGHVDSVNSVAFSPDGEILASGSLDGTVRLWQVPID